MTTLAGHVALVSGGLGDIGSAIVAELAARGAAVSACDLAAEEPRPAGPASLYRRVDVRNRAEVDRWVTDTVSALGSPTLVVACAAVAGDGGIRDLTPEAFALELQVTLVGSFNVAQAGVQRMLESRAPGRVVLVGSWAAHAPHPRITAYCAAKAGLRMLGRCLALELAGDGILVNEVAPGFVDGGLSRAVWEASPGAREEAIERVPTHRLVTPGLVARQVAFLCGPDSDEMTGSTLLVDGGLSLRTNPGRDA